MATGAPLPDKQQCDRFHMCDETGKLAAEFLCEDGLVFDIISKQCALPFEIGREESSPLLLQEPQPIGNCPRQNGKWAVEDTCDQYIDCTSGVESLFTCQNHLVYDDSTGNCEHIDTANRSCCTDTVGESRFAAESDCRAFFTCAVYTGFHPRLGECPVGTVYNGARQICDEPKNVPTCANYYNEE